MMENLQEKLAKMGRDMNAVKTRIFTTQPFLAPLYRNVAGDMVEVLTGKNTHKYLGNLVPGDLKQRTQVEYEFALHGPNFRFIGILSLMRMLI